jgi:predicted RNA-binding Zn-ribbon protein involved in translation (DUF1610 family)
MEHPKPIKLKVKPGDVASGVLCRGCSKWILITEISAPTFQAKCPKCGHEAIYQENEIQSLSAVRLQ